jgi:hypothetical protein
MANPCGSQGKRQVGTEGVRFMKGIIKGIQRNRIAIFTDYGYTVADVQSGEVNINDVVFGNLDDHGDAELKNQTTGHTLSVYIEAIQASAEIARGMLGQT